MQSALNPIDRLLIELINSSRPMETGEVQQIIEHIANAPFDQRRVSVRARYRGYEYQGRSLGREANSLFLHLAKRVVIEEQWADSTTEQEYLEDLRQAVRDPSAKLVVYERGGGNIAAVFAPNIVPQSRLGTEAVSFIYVVYSVDHGIVLSGYQVSGLHTIGIPGSARWLN